MLRLQSERGVRFCDGLTRRDFMRVGSATAGAVGLTLSDFGRARAATTTASSDVNCILLFLVGGPSHVDTFDLKPLAPDYIRGPFRPIRASVPGVQIGEHFPLMACMADKYAIVRSVHHRAAPIHETGHQLMQTGRLFRSGQEYPHYGAVVSHVRGARNSVPPFVVLPQPIGNTGVSISHGQGSGMLGPRHDAVMLRGQNSVNGFRVTDIAPQTAVDPARMHSRTELVAAIDDAQRAYDAADKNRATSDDSGYHFLFAQNVRRAYDLTKERDELRQRYGQNTFGQSCLLARRLVEHGVRLVTVNMFDTVFNQLTWDCHADGGTLPVTLDDYAQTLCPMFDAAYSTLLDDLAQRGMLHNTLVLAMGEFGRTPQLNPRGGRDHWPGVWSVLFAGAGVRGGQVIGASDRTGAEPRERPVSPAEIAASVYHALGINPAMRLPGPDDTPLTLTDAAPVMELF